MNAEMEFCVGANSHRHWSVLKYTKLNLQPMCAGPKGLLHLKGFTVFSLLAQGLVIPGDVELDLSVIYILFGFF
jgi:hypothetical protein